MWAHGQVPRNLNAERTNMNATLKTLLPVMSVAALLVAGNPVYGQASAMPGLTLADDLKTTAVPLVPGYVAKHPRLLFAAEDVTALKKKAEAQPELWAAVLASAKLARRVTADAGGDHERQELLAYRARRVRRPRLPRNRGETLSRRRRHLDGRPCPRAALGQ